MKRILIIEDHIPLAEISRDFLQIEGYDVTIVTDGLEGYNKAVSEQYDLIILDLMLPGMDGYDICRNIRDKIDIPILMVTAKVEEIDKIRGLGLGANDYITKPFSPTEMVARVKSNLAQYERMSSGKNKTGIAVKQSEEIRAGKIIANIVSHRVYVDGVEVGLKNKEYELLVLLISNPDMVFSKEHLYEKIWGMDALGDLKTVTVHIGRLREKIEKDPQNPEHLQTVWGAGYRFKV